MAESTLLTGTRRRRVEKPGRPIAPQIRDDDAIAGISQQRRDAVIRMNIVREAVHQHDGATSRWAALLVRYVEDRGADGLHRGSPTECRSRSGATAR